MMGICRSGADCAMPHTRPACAFGRSCTRLGCVFLHPLGRREDGAPEPGAAELEQRKRRCLRFGDQVLDEDRRGAVAAAAAAGAPNAPNSAATAHVQSLAVGFQPNSSSHRQSSTAVATATSSHWRVHEVTLGVNAFADGSEH